MSRFGLLGPIAAAVAVASLAACGVSPAAGLWGVGLFVASTLLLCWSARAAPGTSTGTDTGSTTATSTTATETGSSTSVTPDYGTTSWGPCLSRPEEPNDDGCVMCPADEKKGGLILAAPVLLALAPTRRRREVIDRLAAKKALPRDVIARLRRQG